MIHGDVTRSSDGLTFGGTDGYVHLPNNLMTGLDGITVSAQVWVDPGQQTPYFLFNLGNSTNNAGDGYLFATGDTYRAAIAPGNWSTEQNANSGRNSGPRHLAHADLHVGRRDGAPVRQRGRSGPCGRCDDEAG